MVIPFGLKITGATFQQMMARAFERQIGGIMEVYVDDLVVKRKFVQHHPQHLVEVFAML